MVQLSFFSEFSTKTYQPYVPVLTRSPTFPNPKLKPYNDDAEDLHEKYYGKSFDSLYGKYPIFNIWYTCYEDEPVELYVQLGTLENIIGEQYGQQVWNMM